jgi:hypothetical protein
LGSKGSPKAPITSRNGVTTLAMNQSMLKTQVSKLLQRTFDRDTSISGVPGGSSSRLVRNDISEVYVPLKKRVELSTIENIGNTLPEGTSDSFAKRSVVNMGIKLLSQSFIAQKKSPKTSKTTKSTILSNKQSPRQQ